MRNGLPETLQEAITYFADHEVTFSFAIALRWPDGVYCPHCESREVTRLATRLIFKCKGCKKQFSVKVGTIFEDSPIPLNKWFAAIWMLANCKNGISSYELARDLGVTQKTGWFMLHRIREAVKAKSFDKKLAGTVEADETFIGGSLKNMHQSKREKLGLQPRDGKRNTGPVLGKTVVQAVLERDGEVRARIIESFDSLDRLRYIMDHAEKGTNVMTDTGYAKLGPDFIHQFINHQHEYVRDQVHTQGIENFWSLLKRGIHGTYISVEPFHLSAYVDEQAFRFNSRKSVDGERFASALRQVAGRRLTYADLTRAN